MKTLWFVMTRTCNLACGYCYQGDHQENLKWLAKQKLTKHMTDEIMAKTLSFAVDWAPTELRVIFYGGEPLIQFDLIKKWVPIWKEAFHQAGKKITFSCTTNGTLLTKEVRDFFTEHDVGILLSIDGPPYIHDKQRPFFGNKPSWDKIPVDEILEWRPKVEVAWQLDSGLVPEPKDVQWMVDRGFQRINFNLNWLTEWDAEARLKLVELMRWVGRLAMRGAKDGSFGTNLLSKFNELFLKDDRQAQPCGTGTGMMAVTPEGWLYPSQEMAFTVVEPGRAPGTAEYYRIGNVHNSPVIDAERLAVVSTIQNSEMKQPPGFDCNNCAAKVISFGGCHCRYVGADGVDPSNRYDVLPGWCQSEQGWVTGFLQAAVIEKYITFRTSTRPQQQKKVADKPQKKIDVSDVLEAVQNLERKFDSMDVLKVQRVED